VGAGRRGRGVAAPDPRHEAIARVAGQAPQPRALGDRLVRIPLFGGVESLNVSVAAGICLYATRAARNRAIAAANGVG